jgi:hypothetical protein
VLGPVVPAAGWRAGQVAELTRPGRRLEECLRRVRQQHAEQGASAAHPEPRPGCDPVQMFPVRRGQVVPPADLRVQRQRVGFGTEKFGIESFRGRGPRGYAPTRRRTLRPESRFPSPPTCGEVTGQTSPSPCPFFTDLGMDTTRSGGVRVKVCARPDLVVAGAEILAGRPPLPVVSASRSPGGREGGTRADLEPESCIALVHERPAAALPRYSATGSPYGPRGSVASSCLLRRGHCDHDGGGQGIHLHAQ